MMPQQFRFGFVKKKLQNNAKVTCVRSIAHLTIEAKHPELFEIKTVKSACDQMVKERNLTVTLPDDKAKLYLDEDQNFVYQAYYLEEREQKKEENQQSGPAGESLSTKELLAVIAKLTETIKANQNDQKKTSPKEAKKHMTLSVFSGADDGPDWFSRFESECGRLEITEDRDLIVLLKSFMEGPAKAWADACERKLTDSDWKSWASAFRATFTRMSWTTVRTAHAFRYLAGSLTDFAIEKQKKLLNIEKEMTDRSLIDHIVVSLPEYARDKLDRNQIKTMNELFAELAKIEVRKQPKDQQTMRQNVNFKPNKEERSAKSSSEASAKVCPICKQLGFRADRHPGRPCRYEDKVKALIVNLTTEAETPEEEELRAMMNMEATDSKN